MSSPPRGQCSAIAWFSTSFGVLNAFMQPAHSQRKGFCWLNGGGAALTLVTTPAVACCCCGCKLLLGTVWRRGSCCGCGCRLLLLGTDAVVREAPEKKGQIGIESTLTNHGAEKSRVQNLTARWRESLLIPTDALELKFSLARDALDWLLVSYYMKAIQSLPFLSEGRDLRHSFYAHGKQLSGSRNHG